MLEGNNSSSMLLKAEYIFLVNFNYPKISRSKVSLPTNQTVQWTRNVHTPNLIISLRDINPSSDFNHGGMLAMENDRESKKNATGDGIIREASITIEATSDSLR